VSRGKTLLAVVVYGALVAGCDGDARADRAARGPDAAPAAAPVAAALD
jgi:outer membrane murein-binding lipoprotein Lpp